VKQSNWDRLFTKTSSELSQRMSRRRMMGMFGPIALGTSFAMGFARNLLHAFVLEPGSPPEEAQQGFDCDADSNCSVSGYQCGGYGQGPNCGNCLITTQEAIAHSENVAGCPAGAQYGAAWVACCPCRDDANQGRGLQINYVDCCGTLDQSRCKGCTSGGRIQRDPVRFERRNGGFVPMYGNCFYPGGTHHNWCALDSRSLPILCTRPQRSTTCCVPGSNAGGTAGNCGS